jgi:hypothetical protein
MTGKVENKVDQIVQDVLSDDDGIDWPIDDPVDPNPGINPNPIPGPDPDDEPFNPGPTWTYRLNNEIEDMLGEAPVTVTGSASVKTTDGVRKTVNISNLDSDDFTDDGLYKD